MIDLHSHVLPAVDDGAVDEFESRSMLERWAGFGFTTVAATPHLNIPASPIYRAEVEDAFDRLSKAAAEQGVSLVSGFEIMLHPDLPSRLESGALPALGGSGAVLVEVPFLQWPSFTESALFDLQTAGFRPVLAHPERYTAVQHRPDLALSLANRGVVLQLTFASLTGALGKTVKRTAELLLLSDAHLILASDAHSNGQRLDAIPVALDRARQLVGDARLRQITVENPAALLSGAPLDEPAPLQPAPLPESRMDRVKRVFSVSR
jgi:protein-tyrosine phosphatase